STDFEDQGRHQACKHSRSRQPLIIALAPSHFSGPRAPTFSTGRRPCPGRRRKKKVGKTISRSAKAGGDTSFGKVGEVPHRDPASGSRDPRDARFPGYSQKKRPARGKRCRPLLAFAEFANGFLVFRRQLRGLLLLQLQQVLDELVLPVQLQQL